MTENEIKKATIEDAIYCAKAMACIEVCEECRFYELCHIWCDDVYGIMIKALEEVQAYRVIGTVEEFKALKEKQEKGLLLELPCKIGDWVWTWEYPTRIDEEDGSTWTICDIKRATIVSRKFNIFMLDRVGENCFVSKEEAEKALAKRQGK